MANQEKKNAQMVVGRGVGHGYPNVNHPSSWFIEFTWVAPKFPFAISGIVIISNVCVCVFLWHYAVLALSFFLAVVLA
jgi:hypothetical protein